MAGRGDIPVAPGKPGGAPDKPSILGLSRQSPARDFAISPKPRMYAARRASHLNIQYEAHLAAYRPLGALPEKVGTGFSVRERDIESFKPGSHDRRRLSHA